MVFFFFSSGLAKAREVVEKSAKASEDRESRGDTKRPTETSGLLAALKRQREHSSELMVLEVISGKKGICKSYQTQRSFKEICRAAFSAIKSL